MQHHHVEEDSEYEPLIRSLNTFDDTASSSNSDYFSTSEEEEKSLEKSRVVIGAHECSTTTFWRVNSYMPTRVFSK